MKNLKFIVLPILLLMHGFGAKAQSGYKYLDISGGFLTTPFKGLTSTLSLDFASKYHDGFEVFAEAYRSRFHEPFKHNYTAGFVYKPLITRSKNTAFRFKIGSGFGSNSDKFIIAPQAGFELSQTLSGAFEIMLQQNNSYVFWDSQHWRSGFALGVKIPIE